MKTSPHELKVQRVWGVFSVMVRRAFLLYLRNIVYCKIRF